VPVVLWIALVAGGCAPEHEGESISGGTAIQMDRGKAVYVSVPQDGVYGSSTHSGSGQRVAQAVADAFVGLANRVHIAQQSDLSQAASMAAGKSAGAGYVVIPVMAHWEQSNASRMAVGLVIMDVETGRQLSASAIDGATASVTMTATAPESLLREPLTQYVRGLY
jgi:hypothetical protein